MDFNNVWQISHHQVPLGDVSADFEKIEPISPLTAQNLPVDFEKIEPISPLAAQNVLT